MRESVEIDHCIIGGGVVGLFTALFLRDRFPNDSICILEKNIFVGEASSSRNSSVLHSGIYYPFGSLKHTLCLEGLDLWRSFNFFKDNAVKTTGKYIFAINDMEIEGLNDLLERGRKNGVEGLRFADEEEVEFISEYVNCISAIYSPSSGLINVPVTLKILQDELEKKDIMIMKEHGDFDLLKKADGFVVKCIDYDINVSYLFNCAGLAAVETRKKLGLKNLTDFYVKGSYLSTSQKLEHTVLLYPVPPANLKGLGVHSTMNWDGSIKFGPNTREVDNVDYSLENENLESMKDHVTAMFKGVVREKLYADYSGVRAKIKLDGKLWTDFWIRRGKDQGVPNYFESCGIESPGLTASPAIGRMLASFVKK